jgi:hypothetical protein
VSYIVRDPAIYFARTLLLRPARETDFRLAPLYCVFEAWQSLTGFSDYFSQAEAHRLLDRGGGWTLWNESGSLQQAERGESWRWRVRVDTFGDDVCLLCGIETEKRLPEQTGQQIEERNSSLNGERDRLREQWLSRTRGFREASAQWIVGVADGSSQASQLRSTGEAWLCLYEWMVEPDWEAFGQARFKGESYLVFDWGLLGVEQQQAFGEVPVFEAHVMATTEKLKRAERFIFKALPELLIFYLKVTQFLTVRYRRAQSPRARELDAELAQLAREVNQMRGRLNLQRAEDFLERVATRLGDFRTVLAEMAIDLHTARIDYENAERLLRNHLPPSHSPQGREEPIQLLRPLKLYLEQAGKDLEYYRLTLDAVAQAMELLKLKTEILRVRFTNVLAAIGAGFGIFLGLGQLIDPNYFKEFLRRWMPGFPLSQYGNISRAALCLLLAVITSLIVHRLLNRFLLAKSDFGNSMKSGGPG